MGVLCPLYQDEVFLTEQCPQFSGEPSFVKETRGGHLERGLYKIDLRQVVVSVCKVISVNREHVQGK